MPMQPISTTVVGSYPQPAWLIDRDRLSKVVPRVRMQDLWRVDPAFLEQAQDDATRLAIADMEAAGIDVITDGEMRRESYSNHFATALDGIDLDNPGRITNRQGDVTEVPRVAGPIRRRGPVLLRDLAFLKRHAKHTAKITLPGPFTMAQQAANEAYPDVESMAMDFAAAVNAEARDLQAAGADMIQLDEPWLRNDPEAARRFACRAIDRALEGITIPTVVHLCFGYAAVVHGQKPTGYSFLGELSDTRVGQVSIECAQPHLDLGILKDLSNKTIVLGVLDLHDPAIETPAVVADRIRAALAFVPAERLVAAPDCGMKYLDRDTAFGKLSALAKGAAIVRAELTRG